MWEGPAHCEQHHPGVGDTGVYKKAGWTSHEEEASKQQSSMASKPAPDTKFLFCLSSCSTFPGPWLWYGRISQTTPSSLQDVFGHGVYHGHRNHKTKVHAGQLAYVRSLASSWPRGDHISKKKVLLDWRLHSHLHKHTRVYKSTCSYTKSKSDKY